MPHYYYVSLYAWRGKLGAVKALAVWDVRGEIRTAAGRLGGGRREATTAKDVGRESVLP
jgi:hypothetical protein